MIIDCYKLLRGLLFQLLFIQIFVEEILSTSKMD